MAYPTNGRVMADPTNARVMAYPTNGILTNCRVCMLINADCSKRNNWQGVANPANESTAGDTKLLYQAD